MKTPLQNNRKSAGRLIGELSRAAQIYFKAEFSHYSIGHAQIPTLIFIANHDTVSQLELNKHLNLDKSSVTSQLKILEKNGYITRSRSKDDARVHQLKITAKTREILRPMKAVFASWTEALFEGFSEEDRNQTFTYLERMKENAHQKIHQIKTPTH